MIEFLKPFFSEILRWGTVAIGAIILYFKIRIDGKKAAQENYVEKTLAGVTERDKIKQVVTNLSDSDINKLYDKEVKRD